MMDGYIKQQNEKIRSIKHIIWAKYGITLLLIVFILFTLVLMLTEQPPEKWTRKEIVFSLDLAGSIAMYCSPKTEKNMPYEKMGWRMD